ncbi:MAG TPA: hypothetical protein VMN82_12615 [Thermoanaerobaculia bacterium]|nr:hypothetical protein [Thermoanaerobaculia bacterium]
MASSRAISSAVLATILLLGPATARAGHRHGQSVSIDDGQDPKTCSDVRVEFDDEPAARAEEKLTIPVESGKPLRIEAAEHSGVLVRGADRADFEVLVCKAAPTSAQLIGIAAERRSGTLSVRGPEDGDWVGYLVVTAPRAAALDISASNGPVKLSGLSGHVVVRSENGPISIRQSSGDIDARAENGPIAAKGDGGRLRLVTENGPIAVALGGTSWKGEGLDARAVNGPVSLSVPKDYRSGTSVESLGHSPFHCRGEACGSLRRTWDDDHKRLELGDGPVVVRLSTENGPVSVRTGSDLEVEDED